MRVLKGQRNVSNITFGSNVTAADHVTCSILDLGL